jgi:5'(3')-deoxyribonucleotidase
MERPARKYDWASELFPFFTPHHIINSRYTTTITISIVPIENDSIAFN